MRQRTGPILTLVAGLVLAAGLMVLNVTVSDADPASDAAATGPDVAASPDGSPGAGPAAPKPPTTPPATTPPPAAPPATYAGNVNGGGATLAIAVKDGTAIAYLCDGKRAEAWLRGPASAGKLDLAGDDGATLAGTLANGVAAGQVRAAGRTFDFSISTVAPPSGLYRASADVRGATLTGGWIVLADGRQVGLANLGGNPIAVPPLDLASRRATVESTTVTAVAVDGSNVGG